MGMKLPKVIDVQVDSKGAPSFQLGAYAVRCGLRTHAQSEIRCRDEVLHTLGGSRGDQSAHRGYM